jgi:SAM-dependent methyltransferase
LRCSGPQDAAVRLWPSGGDKVADWHEDDGFWLMWAPSMFSEERWDKAPEEVEQMLALLQLEPGAALLDLCCGPGRHAFEFARRGYAVTAVDRTAAYLEEARKRAEAEGLSIEFVLRDMRRFRRPGAFGAAVNLFTAFGYFEDPDEDRQVLRNVRESLKPGGRFVMDMMGKEVLARIFLERDWHEEDGVLWLEERALRDDWSCIESRWIRVEGTERREHTIILRLYSASELKRELLDSGFSGVEVFGNFAGDPYDQSARRLVAVATA